MRAHQADFPISVMAEVFRISRSGFYAWRDRLPSVPTRSGFLYLAVALDVFSRRIVGWAMAGHLRTKLVLAALDMAVAQRKPEGVVHHSDHGSQYTSLAFGARCREAGVRPSLGSVGDCFDNAMCESFFATLECELIAAVVDAMTEQDPWFTRAVEGGAVDD